MTTATTRSSPAWTGWITFASVMLVIIGAVNVIEGIFGLIYRTRTVVVASQLYVVNVTGWAIVLVAFGGVMVLTGVGLWTRSTWARVTAIVVVVLHAIAQVGWLSAYPVWSLLMLVLDVVVLFALTARWDVATREAKDEWSGGVPSGWDQRYNEPRPSHPASSSGP